jgi:predicted glutamine amidotransferase
VPGHAGMECDELCAEKSCADSQPAREIVSIRVVSHIRKAAQGKIHF